jgi:acetyltransferase
MTVTHANLTRDWVFELATRDGAAYRVRPIRRDDLARERQFITGLSEESRYSRLLYSMREPSPGFVRQMVEVDYQRTMAFVAVAGDASDEHFIAVARYGADTGGSAAEFAVVVADAWQGRGVGTRLARILFEYAKVHGIARLYGHVLANNKRMIDLVHYLGLSARPAPGDATMVLATLDLDRTPPDRTR